MASILIHVAVAKEINKVINRDEKSILIGSMAPDIAKLLGRPKTGSHFVTSVDNDIPNMDLFYSKYQSYLNDDFVMGYFIHLFTDYLWGKYFMSELRYKDTLKDLDGNIINATEDEFKDYVYNDYTSLNIQLINEYDIPVKVLYDRIPEFKNIIQEIPMNRLDIIVDRAGEILAKTKEEKSIIFDITNIKQFISLSTELILAEIDKLGF